MPDLGNAGMKILAVDLETTGLDPRTDRVRLVQLYDGTNMRIVDAFVDTNIMDELVALFEDPSICKVGHNLAFDMSFARAHAGRRLKFANLHDTMICEQVLTAGWYQPYMDHATKEIKHKMPEYNLAALVKKHLGFVLEKDMQRSNWGSDQLTKEQMAYAARDVEVLLPLVEIQRNLLRTNNLIKTAELEFQTLPAVVEMQLLGMPVDWSVAEQLRVDLQKELTVTQTELEQLVRSGQKSRQKTLFGEDVGIDLNLNSPKQILKYLQDKLGLTEMESSDVEALKTIDHPFAAKLLRYRTLEKQLNFLVQFESFGAKSGRMYPSYNQARASTGRMSSSKPNQQQVPKRGDGKRFRGIFKTTPGKKLVKCDLSAIEMRIMARLAMDKAMTDAILNGVDLHRLTASKVANKTLEEVTKEERQRAKAVNFGFLFAMGAPTFRKYAFSQYGVKVTEEEAQQIRNAFFSLYNGLARWHEAQKQKMYEARPYNCHNADRGYYTNYVAVQTTLHGRKRFWANFAGQTMATPSEYYNMADQGSCADLVKMILVRLYNELPDDCHIVAVVHDEVLLETPEDTAQAMMDLMLKIMREEGSKMLDPIPVDAEGVISDAWG